MCVHVHVCFCTCMCVVCMCVLASVRACVCNYIELFRCYLRQQVFRKHTDSSHSNGIDKTYQSCCSRPQDVTVYQLNFAKLHVTYISLYLS